VVPVSDRHAYRPCRSETGTTTGPSRFARSSSPHARKRTVLMRRPAAWWMIALLCAVSTVSYIERYNLPVVGDAMAVDLRLGSTLPGVLPRAFGQANTLLGA